MGIEKSKMSYVTMIMRAAEYRSMVEVMENGRRRGVILNGEEFSVWEWVGSEMSEVEVGMNLAEVKEYIMLMEEADKVGKWVLMEMEEGEVYLMRLDVWERTWVGGEGGIDMAKKEEIMEMNKELLMSVKSGVKEEEKDDLVGVLKERFSNGV